MYKKTPTTPTGDYARWLADEKTDLTGSVSNPTMATAKDAANELLQSKIDGLIAENAIEKQIEPQPEPQSSIPSMLQKTRAGLKTVRQQLNEPPKVQTEGLVVLIPTPAPTTSPAYTTEGLARRCPQPNVCAHLRVSGPARVNKDTFGHHNNTPVQPSHPPG